MKNKKLNIFLPLILSVFLIIGFFIGSNLNKDNPNDHFFIYPRSNKLNDILNSISENYVDSISNYDLIESTIPQVLTSLDPHSVYIPAKDLQKLNEPLEGNFEGIGIEFNVLKDTVIVVNTISGGPSEMVGLMPGDRIVKVNDSIVAGINISNNDIISLLRGKRGSKVKVGIIRENIDGIIDFEITRDKIPLYSIDVAYMINEELGYIKISRFARNTFDEFLQAIAELKNQNYHKLIIDLRGNGGGYMDAATNIADQFLTKKQLIVYTKGKSKPRSNIYSSSRSVCLDTEVLILIDEWSASASEILAGAIQDNDRGIIVGRRSFGKGLVQNQTIFNDGSALRLTIARYYTPTGRCIQKPYDIENTDDYFNDLNIRYANGEFNDADSIEFSDSLKFVTPKGKVVYGGGGIMPDIFIPLDTTGVTPYYRKIIGKSLIYKFAFDYTDKHRNELSKFENFVDINNYLNKKSLLKKFVSFASDNDIAGNKTEIKLSKKIILNQIKAYIARNIIGNEGFYPIQHEIDHTLQESIKLLSE